MSVRMMLIELVVMAALRVIVAVIAVVMTMES